MAATVFESQNSTSPSRTFVRTTATARCTPGGDASDDHGLCWSLPVEEAIGFLSAGARVDGDGRFRDLALGGDLLQHRACPQQLHAALCGATAGADEIGAALDAVYAARPGLIEGVRSLSSLRTALLDAVQRAREDGRV